MPGRGGVYLDPGRGGVDGGVASGLDEDGSGGVEEEQGRGGVVALVIASKSSSSCLSAGGDAPEGIRYDSGPLETGGHRDAEISHHCHGTATVQWWDKFRKSVVLRAHANAVYGFREKASVKRQIGNLQNSLLARDSQRKNGRRPP